MKNLNIKRKLIALILATTPLTLSITSCNNKNETKVIEEENINETTTTENNKEETKSNDEIIIDSIKNIENDIKDSLNKENFEEAKEKGIDFFISITDFLFYNEPYKDTNITLDDISEQAKKEVFHSLNVIDGWIMEIAPNYKDNLSEKYQAVKDFTSEKYYQVLDKIREYLGDENYNAIKEIKDQIKGDIKEGYNNTKDKIKDKANEWYQEFKALH